MKKVTGSFVVIIIFIIPITARGQNLKGGFGHAYFGAAYAIASNLQSDLRSASLLGSGLQLNRLGMLFGGGGYGLIGRKVLLGGNGYSYRIADATSRGQVTISMGGGFVNAGYLVVNKNNLLGFPYIGIGGNGMKLRIKNSTQEDDMDLGSLTINPGEYADVQSGGINFELGFALKFLAFSLDEKDGNGGFIIGVHAGSYLFAGLENWHDKETGDEITIFSRPFALAPYLRVTIGGGGFSKN